MFMQNDPGQIWRYVASDSDWTPGLRLGCVSAVCQGPLPKLTRFVIINTFCDYNEVSLLPSLIRGNKDCIQILDLAVMCLQYACLVLTNPLNHLFL